MLFSLVLVCKCCLVLAQHEITGSAGILCNECWCCHVPPPADGTHTRCLVSVQLTPGQLWGNFSAQTRQEEEPLFSDLLQTSREDELLAGLQFECF